MTKNLPPRRKPRYDTYLFRAIWRSTGKTIRVPGRNLEDATKRAENLIKRELGGVYCMDLKWIGIEEGSNE